MMRARLVSQRTRPENAQQGHLAEHGVNVVKGPGNLERRAALIRDEARGHSV
ncbi:MAG: hypothetical protein LPJ93_08975 [Rhodobacterales bacterium]|nr:hypothetical protein [Rhodobacterales bacterium]